MSGASRCGATLASWCIRPFAGVGSEGVVALREGRRFVGGELKREYWQTARHNLEMVAAQPRMIEV